MRLDYLLGLFTTITAATAAASAPPIILAVRGEAPKRMDKTVRSKPPEIPMAMGKAIFLFDTV